jgi:hypothetical protein
VPSEEFQGPQVITSAETRSPENQVLLVQAICKSSKQKVFHQSIKYVAIDCSPPETKKQHKRARRSATM